jgi:TolA-binding protein
MPSDPTLSPLRLIFSLFFILFTWGCASRPTAADQKNAILERRIQELTVSLDDKDWQLKTLKEKLDKLEADKIIVRAGAEVAKIDKQAKKPKKISPREEYTITEADLNDGEVEDAPGETIADSRHELLHLYFTASSLIKQKKYEEATKPLRDFLNEAPDHVYADHAQFLICKSYYLSREYELAIIAANTLETKYPHSLKLPEALFVKGSSYMALSEPDPARKAFRSLVTVYPGDAFSNAAVRKLETLSGLAEKAKSSEDSRISLVIDDEQ